MSELVFGQLKGLPVNGNVVTVPSGHTLYAPGHIIQTVSTTKTDAQTSSIGAGTYQAVSGLTATITPKFSTSKFLVTVTLNSSGGTYYRQAFSITRDSVNIGIGDAASTRGRVTSANSGVSGGVSGVTVSGTYLDAPNTTASITYGVNVYNMHTGTVTMYINRSEGDTDNVANARAVSNITVQEIAA